MNSQDMGFHRNLKQIIDIIMSTKWIILYSLFKIGRFLLQVSYPKRCVHQN